MNISSTPPNSPSLSVQLSNSNKTTESSFQTMLATPKNLQNRIDAIRPALEQSTLTSTSPAAIIDELLCLFSSDSSHSDTSSPALAFLFPEISRSLRISFLQSPSTTQIPISAIFREEIAFYRDWRLCGDFSFLQQNWPAWRTLLPKVFPTPPSTLSVTALKVAVEMALAMEDFDFVADYDDLLRQSLKTMPPTDFDFDSLTDQGLLPEAIALSRSLNNRTNDEWRNPWRELSHPAPQPSPPPKSRSAFGLLISESGFHAHIANGEIGFAPHTPNPLHPAPFCTFWSIGPAWGIFRISSEGCELKTLCGDLPLTLLSLSFVTPRVLFNDKPLSRHEDLCWHV